MCRYVPISVSEIISSFHQCGSAHFDYLMQVTVYSWFAPGLSWVCTFSAQLIQLDARWSDPAHSTSTGPARPGAGRRRPAGRPEGLIWILADVRCRTSDVRQTYDII
jgi:hypothetical protein